MCNDDLTPQIWCIGQRKLFKTENGSYSIGLYADPSNKEKMLRVIFTPKSRAYKRLEIPFKDSLTFLANLAEFLGQEMVKNE